MSRIASDLASSQVRLASLYAAKVRKVPKNVGIIGAGVAGLRCAEVLLSHGVNVTIIEGRERLGGRLAQAKLGDHTVDLGPNWIHGTKNNPIYELVKDTNTTTHSFGDVQAVLGPDGLRVPDDVAAECSEILWDLVGEAFKYSNTMGNKIPAEESLMDFLRKNVRNRVRKTRQAPPSGRRTSDIEEDDGHDSVDVQKRIELILSMAGMWGPYVGSETAKQSLRFLWLEECLEGENPFCAGTYSKVLAVVSKPAQEAASIKLGHTAVKIRGRKTSESDELVSIETKDGSKFEFDEVVLTTPLGWLKNNLDAFEPPVPRRFQQAVEALGYGTLDKVYVTFPSAFWDRESDMSTSTSTASSSREASPSSMYSAATGLSNGESRGIQNYPAVTSFLGPPSSSPLNQEAISLSQLPPPHAHPTLLFYTTSRTTTHLTSLLPPHSTPYTSTTPLASPLAPFLTTYLPHLPHYHATHPACTPSAVLATNWAADELAGHGSYTFFPVGLQAGDEDVRVLRQGMPERGVWVAGEHTAPFVALGTVTGAWWSGDAVARRILGLVEAE